MTTSFDALAIRKRLGRTSWGAPTPFGPDGWQFDSLTETLGSDDPRFYDYVGRILVTCSPMPGRSDDELWVHASISFPTRNPTYDELALLHRAVWPQGWAYQVFAPPSHHVNIHEHALHLWGRLDDEPALPMFVGLRSI